MVEKFYILGKLGDSDGFQVYDLKSKTTAQGEDYSFLDTSFHKDGYKELFKISRKGYKTYYTYIKNNLSSDRTGCMLGFSYVYEDNGNVIKDFLGLRQKMKEALNHLLKGNDAIKITSFNDNSVNASLKHIEDFTKKVNAEKLYLSENQIQFPVQNPNDLTNEKIWAILKKSVNVEISEEIPTKLQIKDTEIKNLSLQNQTKQNLINTQGKDIENLRKENDKLKKEKADRDTTIVKLNKDLEDAKKGNGKRDAKISSLLSEISGLLSNDKPISSGQSKHEPVKSKPDNRLSYINIGLSMLIVIILFLFNTCEGGGSETDKVQTLNEEITELNTQKNTLENEKNNLESQVKELRKEIKEKDKKITDLEEEKEKLKKEKKEQKKANQDKKNTTKAPANKTEDKAEKSGGEQKNK
jgi:DNA repair exonuclease SbcCD ATPase subunit